MEPQIISRSNQVRVFVDKTEDLRRIFISRDNYVNSKVSDVNSILQH